MPPDPAPRRLCLVTGASAGIGEAFARLYAGQGYDLALTARRRDRLQALAEELRRRHRIEAQVIAADLADPAAPGKIMGEIAAQGRAVSVLVNNAGYGLIGRYDDLSWAEQGAMLQVMLTAVCELTHRALPDMLAQGFGRVINVASLAGLIPASPGQSLYTPIKAFLVRFSETLSLETEGTGVRVTALCPGLTYTEFHDVNQTRKSVQRRAPAWMWLSAEEVAALGYAANEAGRAICITGAPNRAIAALARLLPESWALGLMGRAYGRLRRRTGAG